MIAALALTLAATSSVSVEVPDQRTPVVGVVLDLDPSAAAFSVVETRAALSEALHEHTPFQLSTADIALEDCAGQFACMLGRLEVALGAENPPRLLILISHRNDGTIKAGALDLPRALAVRRGHPEHVPDAADDKAARDTKNAALNALLVGAPLVVNEPAHDADTARGMREYLDAVVVKAWDKASDVRALGTIAVTIADAADTTFSVDVDGAVVVAKVPAFTLTGVRAGRRQVTVTAAERAPYREQVTLEPGATVELRGRMPYVDPKQRLSSAETWSAVAVAGVGAAMIVTGAVRAGDVQAVCLTGGACPGQDGFPRLFPGEGAGSGPLAVPLGYSLISAAASYVLVRVLSDDEVSWWWAAAIGLATGAVAYTVSEVAAAP